MFKIALDAGHGLYTSGKRCLKSLDKNETREWVLNDRICDRIEELLLGFSGYELIRVDDTTGERDIALQSRTDKANAWGADFYLSVHHDAGLNGKFGGGATVYAYTLASAKSREYQSVVYEKFVEQTGKFGNRSMPMASKNLHVLRETKMPAVLIECGFMDSPEDVPLILSEEFAEKAARGLVNAIVEIGNLKRKEETAVQHHFTDIKNHYAEEQIVKLYEYGIIGGTDENHFSPDEPLKRADAAIIARNIIRYLTGK